MWRRDRYLMCVAAASVAEATTYPLDLCKTRWECPLNPFVRISTILNFHHLLDFNPSQASDSRGVVLWQGKRESLQRDASHNVWHCQRRGHLWTSDHPHRWHLQGLSQNKVILTIVSLTGVVPVMARHAACTLQTCYLYWQVFHPWQRCKLYISRTINISLQASECLLMNRLEIDFLPMAR